MSYILIVEDNIDNAEILSIYLTAQNLPTQHLINGHEVVSSIISNPPALIFMDVNLPDDDGRVLCRTIKDRLGKAAPPIIIMTAGGDSYKKVAVAMGADDFLSKPIKPSQIVEILKTYLSPEGSNFMTYFNSQNQ